MCVQYLPKYLWVLLLKVFFNPIHLGAQAVNHVFSVFQQESLARISFERVLARNVLSSKQNTFIYSSRESHSVYVFEMVVLACLVR